MPLRAFWVRFQDNFVTRDDIQFLKQAGFNSCVAVQLRSFTPEDQPGVWTDADSNSSTASSAGVARPGCGSSSTCTARPATDARQHRRQLGIFVVV